MRLEDFDYELPVELIAQEPPPGRTDSRLLVLDRKTRSIHHRVFPDLLEYLRPDDFLVFNDTRVIPARLFGVKEKTGGKVEILLVSQIGENTWEALVKPGKRVKPGHRLIFADGRLSGEVIDRTDQGTRVIHFQSDHFMEDLIQMGEVPLPPYIKKPIEDRDRYQTIFAQNDGSSAAPTAGLHFTDEIFSQLKDKGIGKTYITLHIGPGTFRPVKSDRIQDHDMHSEFYRVSGESLCKIAKAKQEGGRIIPVGTTAARTLESLSLFGIFEPGGVCGNIKKSDFEEVEKQCGKDDSDIWRPTRDPEYIYDDTGTLAFIEGWTDLFLYPGYQFRMADALITNFHLPRSTLIMLVSALAGRDFTLEAYQEAVSLRYRFFSFGDCMLII
ncbi:MAG: tRNA preQ1(34) S-adenosylmethionine ribosyltransferase-isomerase QueA [Candidatus Eremiobacteraeota bacterium]|nr:tRNA preQ1(34) S-adenosylmethionine ribosyltransferase-isomerase QueA [Candidatus Eremiobacteraeota bacterium]